MNKKILASLNEICDELDELGMNKEANEITNVMKRIAGIDDRASVEIHFGKPVVLVTNTVTGKQKTYFGPAARPGGIKEYFKSLQHAINYARRIDPNAEVPEVKVKRVGPTNKPWTRDDQEMFDFEADREERD